MLERNTGRVISSRMDCSFGEDTESFVIEQHHEGHSKSTAIAGELQDIVTVFELLLCLFGCKG